MLLLPARPLRLLQKYTRKHSTASRLFLAAGFSAKNIPFDPVKSVRALNADPTATVHAASAAYRSTTPTRPTRERRPVGPKYLSGEDAFFASSTSTKLAFGVVDGVGGWVESGVDPAVFAHGLCTHLASAASQSDSQPSPTSLLQSAFVATLRDSSITAGGSTALVAFFDPGSGQLETANLGDSGFVILRPRAVGFASPPQTHAFNTPFQLAKMPVSTNRPHELFFSTISNPDEDDDTALLASAGGDSPSDAATSTHLLKPTEIVILATDGLWDNLFPADVLAVVGPVMESAGLWPSPTQQPTSSESSHTIVPTTISKQASPALASKLAHVLTAAAKEASHNVRRDGPFARAAQSMISQQRRQLGLSVADRAIWSGGKVDDICVIVGVAA